MKKVLSVLYFLTALVITGCATGHMGHGPSGSDYETSGSSQGQCH